jgi:hypothetical protein
LLGHVISMRLLWHRLVLPIQSAQRCGHRMVKFMQASGIPTCKQRLAFTIRAYSGLCSRRSPSIVEQSTSDVED